MESAMSLGAISVRPAAVDAARQVETPDLRLPFGRESFAQLLELRHAGTRRVTIRYEWQGPEDAPLVIVAGGISAHRHVGACAAYPEPGWWPQQAGEGLALDTSRFRLLAIDWLGA